MSDPKKEADKLRQEAKDLLKNLFKLPKGFSDGRVDRLVDCIIYAAFFEIVDLDEQVTKTQEEDHSMPYRRFESKHK